ncbi:hypothetical protein PG984_001685 [Apiospora sp. TS-2023a]
MLGSEESDQTPRLEVRSWVKYQCGMPPKLPPSWAAAHPTDHVPTPQAKAGAKMKYPDRPDSRYKFPLSGDSMVALGHYMKSLGA